MQSEKQYLSQYNINDFERPSVTTDIAAFMIRSEETDNYKRDSENRLSILLVKRGVHPYKDCWALPGGFLKPDETVEECALREITEETNVTPVALLPIGVFSEPGRDPRGWIISNAFFSVITEESVKQVGGDDAADAQWFDVFFEQENNGDYHLSLSLRGSTGSESVKLDSILKKERTKFGKNTFMIKDSGGLAFDHAGIIAAAVSLLRNYAQDFNTIFDFLPEKFTLNEVQKVQETILNTTILPANFRRKINDYVIETDEYTQGAGHRPARLYRRGH
ncbi:MAG: NUDIX hydrolase [Lachnospiraceae bacterium]|nr:NUDIX hydrolase [Lachnospiraceae bacterium]